MANIAEKGLTRKAAMDVAAQIEAQNILLIGEKIGIIRDPVEESTTGGIILPHASQSKPLRGTVVAIGQAALTEGGHDLGIRVGDRVTFTKYRGQLHSIPLVNGDVVHVEAVHWSDIYFVWRH